MSGKFQELRELLVKYLSCYEEFYEVQKREKEFLTKMNMQDLASNNNRKETIALEVKMVEESRLRLCESRAEDFAVEADDINFEFV
ncbi:MAG: hypothetical protein GY852_00370, partial [bacterium]|nr:hypothetical protein [bacterium]